MSKKIESGQINPSGMSGNIPPVIINVHISGNEIIDEVKIERKISSRCKFC